jgi:hypothetical protein
MPETSNDILYPCCLILPNVPTALRDTLIADVGTLIYNPTTSKVNFCKVKAAGAGNWEAITSA